MKFLVQRINRQVVHDFAFHLVKAKEFFDWRKEKMTIRFSEGKFDAVRNPDQYVPVGSVDFVSEYLRRFYPEAVRALAPLNVPECLFPFAGREIINVRNREDVAKMPKGMKFLKHMKRIKYFDNGIADVERDTAMFVGFQVSQVVDIDSEWRVFVFKNEVQYVANYAGNPYLFPEMDVVFDMVEAFKDEAPVAYTLDVGLSVGRHGDMKTFVVECHRFFSCGLYGFQDYSVLPYMFSQEWFEMKNLK